MRVLITGGCGFLGSNLAAAALGRGFNVVLFDNLARDGTRKNLSWLHSLGQFRLVEKDVRDADAVREIIREVRPSAIFHLAAQAAMANSIADPRHDFEVNAL